MNETLNGINYVRFSSTAKELDKAGFLIGSVKVDIDNPYAPPCSQADQIEHEKRYIEKMIIPFWIKANGFAVDDYTYDNK